MPTRQTKTQEISFNTLREIYVSCLDEFLQDWVRHWVRHGSFSAVSTRLFKNLFDVSRTDMPSSRKKLNTVLIFGFVKSYQVY